MKKIVFLLAGLLSLSLNAYAARGGGTADTGGGNAVGGQLLDLFESEGTTPINVTQLKAYQQVLKPLLGKIDYKVPGFSEYLQAKALKKTWLLDPKDLSPALCTNKSMIAVKAEVVACQGSMEVRILKPWFEKADLKNQAALILHELFRSKAIETDKLTDEEVNYLTRTFFAVDNYTDLQLGEALAGTGLEPDNGWGSFGFILRTHVTEVQGVYKEVYQKFCTGSQRISQYDAYNIIRSQKQEFESRNVSADEHRTAHLLLEGMFRAHDLSASQFCKYLNQELMK